MNLMNAFENNYYARKYDENKLKHVKNSSRNNSVDVETRL
jgi:hypothetical protein